MKDKRCFTLIRGNCFYFMTDDGGSISKCCFDDIEEIPGVYCFSNLFNKLNENAKKLKKVMSDNELFNKALITGKEYLKEIYVAVPDDVQPIEKKFLEEFFMASLGSGIKVNFKFENMLAANEDKNYICIYKTCRMFVITYVGYGEIKAQQMIERKEYSEDEIRNYINNLHYDAKEDYINVYLLGDGIEKYSSIGKVVDDETLFRNYIKMWGACHFAFEFYDF